MQQRVAFSPLPLASGSSRPTSTGAIGRLGLAPCEGDEPQVQQQGEEVGSHEGEEAVKPFHEGALSGRVAWLDQCEATVRGRHREELLVLGSDQEEGELSERDQADTQSEGLDPLKERPPWRGEQEGHQQRKAVVLGGDPELPPELHYFRRIWNADHADGDDGGAFHEVARPLRPFQSGDQGPRCPSEQRGIGRAEGHPQKKGEDEPSDEPEQEASPGRPKRPDEPG